MIPHCTALTCFNIHKEIIEMKPQPLKKREWNQPKLIKNFDSSSLSFFPFALYIPKPLAATSVAIKTFKVPSLKDLKTQSLSL